jgi:broad specificity phosphatase PhoE
LQQADNNSIYNHYVLLRHGKSEANEHEIILSDPKAGVTGYGLTSEGRMQVTTTVQAAREHGLLDAATIIYSSDFKRCRETAEIARAILQCGPVQLTPVLRERFFGRLEHTHHSNYQKVWDLDKQDSDHTEYGVESARAVLKRTTGLIHTLEARYHNATILLVSHGDALQILQTAFEHVSPAHHRQLPHLAPAEIRAVS